MRKKHNKPGAGRKQFEGKKIDIVIQKLEQVWGIGGSDKEASFFAEISPAALSDFLKRNPKISERKESLKNRPILKARQEVIKGLEGNPEFALKYLERKLPDEFALRQKYEHSGDKENPISIIIQGVNLGKYPKPK